MGVVTVTRRQLAYGAAVVALLLAVRYWTRPEPAVETVTAEHPLVIEAPSLRVVSGADTVTIMGRALFSYDGLDPSDPSPPERVVDAARALEAALVEAGPGLQALGIRVITVDLPPIPLGVPTEVDAAAGPRLATGVPGVLLADERGHVLRVGSVTGGAALVCAAARAFGQPPPGDYAAACR